MTGPRYSQAGLQALKAGSRIVPARQALNLLAAVDDLPPAHDCPGLAECFGHPRWTVLPMDPAGWHGRRWGVIPPRRLAPVESFDTQPEAMTYATVRARADQLAAITHSEGTDALPADLETP